MQKVCLKTASQPRRIQGKKHCSRNMIYKANGFHSFNPFPANQAFDSSHNPYTNTQQFPQMTGMTNMSFQDPIAAQQRTGFGNGFSNPYQQGGSLSPWGAFGNNIQAQMTGMPQQTQFTGLAPFQTNPSMGFSMQQQQQQPQFTGATNLQTSTATGIQSNNPFGQFGSTSQAQTLQPQQTGFTNQALSMQPTGLATPVNTQQTATPQTATSSFTPSAQVSALATGDDDCWQGLDENVYV